MNLFGRKKEEEFDDETEDMSLEEGENLETRRLKRKLRDLQSEHKKNRKEPLKPWGKKERLIVAGFFLVTTLGATIMFLFSHEFKFPGLPRLSLSDINFKSPFKEEVIQIGRKDDISENDEKAQTIISRFKDNTTPLSGHYGFMVIRLKNGVRYGVSNNEKFQGASLIKLPLMILMYRMSEEGNFDLDTKYILKDSDKIKGSGDLYTAKAGTTYTYRKLAEQMGKNSDRTAYKIMKDIIGETRLKNYISELGMKDTNIYSGETTPDDLGLIFQRLWNGDLTNQADKDEILGFLTNTIYEKWITAGVPKTISVFHKFGQDIGVMADGGIIKTENPYILIIMGQGITSYDADNLFPRVSKDVYEIETGDK
jgi:beta-lactamase class A